MDFIAKDRIIFTAPNRDYPNSKHLLQTDKDIEYN